MPAELTDILALASRNQQIAREVVAASRIVEIWQSFGAKVNQVGSLATGLLTKHRDIDFHIYLDRLEPQDGLAALSRLAESGRVTRIEYTDFRDTEAESLDYHAYYRHTNGEIWQLDLIQIRKGSRYDGHFEEVAARIKAALTPESRSAILTLKYLTPESEKIMGIEYCRAVLDFGVRTYRELQEWRQEHPPEECMNWMP